MPDGRRRYVRRIGTSLTWLAVLACGGDGGTAPPATRVASVEVSGPLNALGIGQTMQLTAVVRDSMNTAIAGAAINWVSSAPAVASISSSGLVRGAAAGSATVTASSGGKSSTWDVVVRDTASLPRVLSGRVERVNATLSGVYTVPNDFTLIADSAIRIDGTLMISPGVRLTLWANHLVEMSGTIEADVSAASAHRLTSNRPTALPDEHEGRIYVGVGANTVVLRKENLTVGCPLAFAGGPNGESKLEIHNSTLIASAGSPGTKAHPDGGPGCAVEIGTEEARRQLSLGMGGQLVPVSYFGVFDSKVTGGTGGDGLTLFTDDGRIAANTWNGVAGSGGKGGLVGIDVTNLEVRNSEIRPGAGGEGGFINVILRDGSGPGGVGESLFASTGGAGPAGDLVLFAKNVIAAGKFLEAEIRAPGGLNINGGNGRSGAKGGDLVMIVGDRSARGVISVPTGVTVEDAVVDPNRFFSARISNAVNGGDAATEFDKGGNGGNIHFLTATGMSAPLKTIILDKVSNGGLGFDGCAIRPKKSGTDGGDAGVLQRKQTPMTQKDGFNGGHGGPGFPSSGKGGQYGVDADAGNLALGSKGADAMTCADLLGLSTIPSSFQHLIETTGCPQLVASPILTNLSTIRMNYTASFVSGWLTWGNATGTLDPGASTTLPITFSCNRSTSFNEEGRISGTVEGGGATQTITVPITGHISYLAVRLNHPLGAYPAGSVIPLSRIGNGRLNGAHPPFCAVGHLHAVTPDGIVIADGAGGVSGPHPDPEPGACGYGEIITVLSPVTAFGRR